MFIATEFSNGKKIPFLLIESEIVSIGFDWVYSWKTSIGNCWKISLPAFSFCIPSTFSSLQAGILFHEICSEKNGTQWKKKWISERERERKCSNQFYIYAFQCQFLRDKLLHTKNLFKFCYKLKTKKKNYQQKVGYFCKMLWNSNAVGFWFSFRQHHCIRSHIKVEKKLAARKGNIFFLQGSGFHTDVLIKLIR